MAHGDGKGERKPRPSHAVTGMTADDEGRS